MTNNEKKAIIEKSALAYYSGFSGLEIKDIEYGIDDHIVFVAGAWYGKKSVHRAKINTTMNGKLYFNYRGNRVHLDECIRCNAF